MGVPFPSLPTCAKAVPVETFFKSFKNQLFHWIHLLWVERSLTETSHIVSLNAKGYVKSLCETKSLKSVVTIFICNIVFTSSPKNGRHCDCLVDVS